MLSLAPSEFPLPQHTVQETGNMNAGLGPAESWDPDNERLGE